MSKNDNDRNNVQRRISFIMECCKLENITTAQQLIDFRLSGKDFILGGNKSVLNN